MPRRRKTASARPTSIQLPLFAETASLVRIRPALNEWRYYRLEVRRDLFGRALLVRQWGRIGTEGRRRLDPHPDPGAALNGVLLDKNIVARLGRTVQSAVDGGNGRLYGTDRYHAPG